MTDSNNTIRATAAPGCDPPQTTRREFLRSAGRIVALGGLIIGTSYLVGRSKDPAANTDSACPRRFPCDNCSLFDDCSLPKALAARQSQPSAPIKG